MTGIRQHTCGVHQQGKKIHRHRSSRSGCLRIFRMQDGGLLLKAFNGKSALCRTFATNSLN